MTYQEYREWKGWRPESFGTFSRNDGAYFSAELGECGIAALAGARVLEIGYGNGAFAGWATKQGSVYTGVEVDPELIRCGRQYGLDVHLGEVPLGSIVADDSLDIVIAIDVLEHLDRSEIGIVLRSAHQVLRHGGSFIARVPSGDSPFARSIQHGDLTHRCALGSSAVRQLAAETGFQVEQVRAPVLPLFSSGARSFVRRAVVRLSRAVLYPVMQRLFMDAGGSKSLVLSPSMVFVLRKQGQG